MFFEMFHNKFPELAEKETRTMIIIGPSELPRGTYALVELYCNEAGCDCRRVFFNVYSKERNGLLAVIAYGWEDNAFYEKWLGNSNPRIIKELKGPTLNLASPQSELAPILLEHIDKYILDDDQYIERIKRHYRMFKDAIDKKGKRSESRRWSKSRKIGRNDPCICGSGKKSKNCCLIMED